MLTNLPFQKEYERYHAVWEDLRPMIDENIDRNRKADCALTVVDAQGKPLPGATVSVRQENHDFVFGCNGLMAGGLGEDDAEYERLFAQLFNLVTTTLCWSVTEYEPGKFRFKEGVKDMFRRPPIDRMIAFAQRNGLKLKGQPLLADSWYPDWASRDAETLKKQIVNYFHKVAEHCGDKLDIVDVVNEAFCCPGRNPDFCLLDKEFSFVDWAFEAIRGVFPDKTLLELNEATFVNEGRSEEYFQLARRLLDGGKPLQAVGIQFHMFNREGVMRHIAGEHLEPRNLARVYERFNELNLPLYITEVTVPSNFEATRGQGEALQAEIVDNLYRLWFSVKNMAGIIYWNLKDGPAWKSEGDCLGCLLDEHLREKPSYQALYQRIHRDWTTRETLEADAAGQVRFRGFPGDYTAEITAGGVARKAAFRLDKTGVRATLEA